jgi:predicted deacylase
MAGLARGQAKPAPKLISGTLAANTPFATPYYVHESGQAGPIVLVTGGVHGDEPAGAAAAEEIRHWRVARGRLIIVPRLNVPGLMARQRTMPGAGETLADLNRNFPRVGKEEPPRGTPATEIWRFVQKRSPNWLVDLHEAHTLHGTRRGSEGNLLLCCPSPEMTEAQRSMLSAINATIPEAKRKFAVGRAPKDGSLARAAGEHLGVHALIVETTHGEEPLAVRVEQHCRVVRALLNHLAMKPSSKDEDHR